MPQFSMPTGPLPTDPDEILAEYASLLSYYSKHAPSPRSYMPAPTAAAATSSSTAYTPRFTSTTTSTPTRLPTNPAGQGIDTTTTPPINPGTRQYLTTTSTSLSVFLLLLLLIIYVFFHHESARMQRLLAAKRRAEEMRYWSRYGTAREEVRRKEEGRKWEEGREREEMEEKVEEAARVMREGMMARLGLRGEDGIGGVGVGVGVGTGMGIKVDDRWRYRMRAEDREREMRKRGIPVVVEYGEEMEVDEPVRVYEVAPQEQVQGVDAALTAAVEWMRMVIRIVSFELKILTKGALKMAGMAGAVWLAYRVVRYFMKEDYEREGDRVDWFLQVGLHFGSAIFGTLILPVLIVAAFSAFLVRLDDTVQVCNLCGGRPIDQQHVKHTEGADLCQGCRIEHEERIENEKKWGFSKHDAVVGGIMLKDVVAAKKQKQDEEEYARKASTLPSGQRFSPVPWRQQPRNPSALSPRYSSEDAVGRYSGYRPRSPVKNQRQKMYNSFEARQAFMTPIAEEDEYTGPVTRSMRKGTQSQNTWNDAWFAEADARLPIETRRLLQPQRPTRWEKTPTKRFL